MRLDARGEAVMKRGVLIIVRSHHAVRQRTGEETTAHGHLLKADARKETVGTIRYIQMRQHAMQPLE